MKKQETVSEKRSWLWEFSKKIVWIVTVMFVVIFTFCCVLLVFYPDSMAIQFVIENISRVFEVTVVCYALKAGFENVFKIRKGDNNDGICSEQLGIYASDTSSNSRSG